MPVARSLLHTHIVFGAALSLLVGCSGLPKSHGSASDDPSVDGTTGGGGGAQPVVVPNGASSDPGGDGLVIDIGDEGSEGGAAPSAGNGEPEVCDGIDNDGNGIVDDVDVGHDGVCDCLNIATIGHIGPWSDGGNLFASWLNARSPLGAVELADEELTAEKLAKFQVIVVLHAATLEVMGNDNARVAPAHHAFSDAEVNVFDAWVRKGGGVMTTIGYTAKEADEVVNVNKLLSGTGMGYSKSKLDLSGMVQNWRTHPLSDGITQVFTDNGVEPDTAGGTTVATNGDKIALQAAQIDAGRVAIWGDEWITYDSEWVDTTGQQVEHFWLNLLKWLSPPTECQVPIPPRVK
jgi:hypothetical protein